MPDYSQILDGELEVRDPGTTSLFARLRGNALAIAAGGSGAPQFQTDALDATVVTEAKLGALAVTTAKIDANAVTQAKFASAAIKQGNLDSTAVADFIILITNNYTLTGGQYVFMPLIGAQTQTAFALAHNGTSATTNLATTTGRITYRYINASPPYDLGDGEFPLFAFAWRRAGKLLAVGVMADPPWAYNGPTRVQVDFEIEGKGYQYHKPLPAASVADAIRRGLLGEYLEAMRHGVIVCREVDQAVKNADMPLFPHPFPGAQPGDDVLLIDPLSPALVDLVELVADGHSAAELIAEGVVVLGEPVDRHGPPGVTVVSAHWRAS